MFLVSEETRVPGEQCYLHTERPEMEPATFLWGNGPNHYNTGLPINTI